MRWPYAVLVAGLAGCSFGGTGPGTPTDGAPGADAPVTDAPGAIDGPGGGDGPMIDGRADASPPDASPPDANLPDAGFDPASCPSSYAVTIAAAPQSRYRWITSSQSWATQMGDCRDDTNGWTHLVAFGSLAEAQGIAAVTTTITYHVGASQAASQGSPSAGWFLITGEALPAGLWEGGQPNDNGGGENNAQNRASVYSDLGPGLQDVDSIFAASAVCECDGKPVDPTVAGFP